jgi:hypothetical protein
MKALLFTGLVLGSVTYLAATQTDVLHGWLDDFKPQAEKVVSESQTHLDRLFDEAKPIVQPIKESALVKQLTDTVSELKEEMQAIKSQIDSARNTQSLDSNDVAKNQEPSGIANLNGVEHIATQGQYSGETDAQKVAVNETTKPINTDVAEQWFESSPKEGETDSPYMPIKERSNALMALVHRMEIKAAGY